VFGPGTGYTWNVLGGCFHGCRWTLRDGNIAECYARTVAEGIAEKHYPHGFEHSYWHPDRLKEPAQLKTRAGIFLDSMSDALGSWVKPEHFSSVMAVCRNTPQHVYFLLTKNPKRIPEVIADIPRNVWIGVSSPPDFMFAKERTLDWKQAYMDDALTILKEAADTHVTWMSFEPLSQPWDPIVAYHPGALAWAVIGAASKGSAWIQPEKRHVQALLEVLDEQNVLTFFKGNLRPSMGHAFQHWRTEYPPVLEVQRRLIE
jgi:protein gp37